MEFVSDVSTEDLYRPSFFELAAQEQLRDLLAPVVRYVLSVFAQRHPRYLLRIVNRHDEFYALVMLFVERHYLKIWGASFAEHFYGLKRRRRPRVSSERTATQVDLTPTNERLGSRELRWSLFYLVGVPYFKAKAHHLYEQLGGGVDSDLFSDSATARTNRQSILVQETSLEKLKRLTSRAYKYAYPRANLAYELWLLCYNVGYLFDKTPYWRPWLALMNVDIRRMSAQDYEAAQKVALSKVASPLRRHPVTGRRPTWATVLGRCLLLGPRYAFEALKVILPTSIFFFKFLEWWYSSDYARTRAQASGARDPALKPPKPLAPHPRGVLGDGAQPLRYGRCPLCRLALVNSTALGTGWVYCYKCVHGYVAEHGRCPVTLSPAKLDDLRRIVG